MNSFKVGDFVKIKKDALSNLTGLVGQITFIAIYLHVTIDKKEYYFKMDEVEPAYKFNIGDEVQIPWSAEMLRKGIYTISKLPHDNFGYYLLKDKNGSYEGSFSESGIVKYEAPVPEKSQPKFQIGDYVYVYNYLGIYDGMVGQIYYFVENDKYWGGKNSYSIDVGGSKYSFPEQNLLPVKKQEQLKIPTKSDSKNSEYVLVPKEDLTKIMELPSVCYNCNEIMNRWYNVIKQ